MVVTEFSLVSIKSDPSEREFSIMPTFISVWSVCPVAGQIHSLSYFRRRLSFGSCLLQSTSRSAATRRQLHWQLCCRPATLPEPGYATCGQSARLCAPSTDISRRSAGSESNRDLKPAHDNAVTTELHTPAAQSTTFFAHLPTDLTTEQRHIRIYKSVYL